MAFLHPRLRPSNERLKTILRTLIAPLAWLPPANFLSLHYAYFIGVSLISAVIFWGSSTPARSVSFTDSLFLTTSAMTLAGLNTVNLSTLNTFQQVLLFLLIMLGSAILVSAVVVHVRRKAFEVRFKEVIQRESQERRRKRRDYRNNLSRSWTASEQKRELPADGFPRGILAHQRTGGVRSSAERIADGIQDDGRQHSPGANSAQDSGRRFEGQRGSTLNTADKSPDRGSHMPDGGDEREEVSIKTPRRSLGGNNVTFSPGPHPLPRSSSKISGRRRAPRFLSLQGVGAHSDTTLHLLSSRRPSSILAEDLPRLDDQSTQHHVPFGYSIWRNSQMSGLSHAERERLGGVEYRCIEFLSFLVPVYFVLWQLLSCLGLGAYVANNRPDTARTNGMHPWWVGAFNAVSAFNNSGMSLLDANMVAFQTSIYMLITMSLLILAGNTCYPIFLRFIIWTMRKIIPDAPAWQDYRVTLQFLLDHPRRCYTNLFPAQQTWWLLCMVIMLNGVDWAAYEILNIGNAAIQSFPIGIRVIDGLFQAFAVRSGGFYVVSIPSLRVSLQFLYVVMMYISAYPIALTIRSSNVYEERSLGIYADDIEAETSKPEERSLLGTLQRRLTNVGQHETRSYFVRQQIRAQLSHDAWWLCVAIFLILIVESGHFETDPEVFSVFNVIFETVSAYATVGISVGLPNEAYSFCGAWHKLSKLILCAVMLRGRHRGLPVVIDRAVLLPSQKLHEAEEEDAQIRMSRSFDVSRTV